MVAGNLEDLYIRNISQKLAHLDLGKPEDPTSHLAFILWEREILWERGIWSMKNYSFRYSFRKRVISRCFADKDFFF